MSLPEFSSEAFIFRYVADGSRRRLCVDAGLAGLVSRSYRVLALLYPPESCRDTPLPGAPRVESVLDAGRLFERLVESCREAERIYSSWRKRSLLLRLISPPSREEVESGEAYHAMMVCSEAGLWGARLEEARRGWLWYRRGSGEWRRLEALLRVDEELVARLSGLMGGEER